jgi:hypothetical protein
VVKECIDANLSIYLAIVWEYDLHTSLFYKNKKHFGIAFRKLKL